MKKNQTAYEWGDVLRPTKEAKALGLDTADYVYFLKYDPNGYLKLIRSRKATIEIYSPDYWEILPK